MVADQLLFNIEQELILLKGLQTVKNEELQKINDVHQKVTEALSHLAVRIELLEKVKNEYRPKVKQ